MSGVEKFGRYFKKKGWIGAGEEAEAERRAKERKDAKGIEKGKSLKWWDRSEKGVRLVVEFATAYAIVKALLPVRIFVSVWAAPWFARWSIIPFKIAVKRLFLKKKVPATPSSPAAGTNAVGSNTTRPGKT